MTPDFTSLSDQLLVIQGAFAFWLRKANELGGIAAKSLKLTKEGLQILTFYQFIYKVLWKLKQICYEDLKTFKHYDFWI